MLLMLLLLLWLFAAVNWACNCAWCDSFSFSVCVVDIIMGVGASEGSDGGMAVLLYYCIIVIVLLLVACVAVGTVSSKQVAVSE